MVTHIDIARKRFDISRFTLQELAQALKVSYGLARKYALQWAEEGLVTKIKRSGANVSDNFVFVRSRMPEESMAALERYYEQSPEGIITEIKPPRKTRGEAIRPKDLAPTPSEEEVDELVKSYLDEDIYPPLGANIPMEDDYKVAPTIDMLLSQIMTISSNWKARALTAEKDNDRIKQALAEFLVGLKSEEI